MEIKLKERLEKVIDRLPSPRLLFAIVVAIVLGVIIYLSILFILSN